MSLSFKPSSLPLKRAALGGLIAALLATPIIGLELNDQEGGLTLIPHWNRVVWIAIIVIGSILAGAVIRTIKLPSFSLHRLSLPRIRTIPPKSVTTALGWLMIGFAVALPFMPFSDRGLLDKAILILIYVMLGWGLNIVVGWAGLLDLGYVGFYAIGAYSYALLAQYFHLSFWACLPLSGVIAAFAGLLLGFPVLRLRGDYLAIVTLGFGEIIRIILINWQSLTGGPNGISSIPRPNLFGLVFAAHAPTGEQTFADFFGVAFSGNQRIVYLYFIILLLALGTNFIALRLRRLPLGRAWEALREDEIACRSLGLNPTTIKLSAFAIGAGLAGLGGAFFATRQGFISPESFTFMESAIILSIVVLGGMGSQIGIVIAAILLVGLPEWFRELHQYRMLAFGVALVAIMLFRPSGLVSSRQPGILLPSAGAKDKR